MESYTLIEGTRRRVVEVKGTTLSNFIGIILMAILISRYTSEALTTYVWNQTNQIWAILALVGIGFLLWPLMTIMNRDHFSLCKEYWPILAYLVYLALRTNYGTIYSIKCYFSEFIIWFMFMFTREACGRDKKLQERVIYWAVLLGKMSVLTGLGQIAWCSLQIHSLDLLEILDRRPVIGIFDHPTSYITCNFFFIFYFLKKRNYIWMFFTIFTCLFTGTRSPFVASLCIGLMVVKSAISKSITWKDIVITLLISFVVYFIMVSINMDREVYVDWKSRESQASLNWRINFWKNFLKHDGLHSFWLGHGVGAADSLFDQVNDRPYPPHNDYVRIFYDSGILGFIIFLNLMWSMLRTLKSSSHVFNDYILLSFVVILLFCFTDNFLYLSYSMLVMMFLASSAASKFNRSGPHPAHL